MSESVEERAHLAPAVVTQDEQPVVAVLEDDDDAILGVEPTSTHDKTVIDTIIASEGLAEHSNTSVEAPVITLQDVFGDFVPRMITNTIEDPKHFDFELVLASIFGEDFTAEEAFDDFHKETDADDHRERIIREALKEEALQPCRDVFGDDALDFLGQDLAEGGFENPSIVTTSRPTDPFDAERKQAIENRLWLLEMAKVYPNRQTLHFESQPFDPKTLQIPQNNARHFYTPQSVIRWVRSADGKKNLSNAIVVQWSEGPATLHVGCDVYELLDSHERSLNMLAKKQPLDEGDGVIQECIVEAVQADRHVIAVAAPGVVNSVNEALVHEKVTSSANAKPSESVPFLLDAMPPMRTPKEIAAASGRHQSLEEQLMASLREKRRKMQDQMRKEGIAICRTDEIAQELEDLETVVKAVRDATIQDVLEQLRVEEAKTKLQRAENRAARNNNTNRFNRTTTLQHVDGSGETFEYPEEDRIASERRSRSPSSDADIGDLLGERREANRPQPPEYD